MTTMNPFVRKPVLPIRPAFDATNPLQDFWNIGSWDGTGGSGGSGGGTPPTRQEGLSQESINGIIGGVTGVLNTTANTILGTIQSNNQVEITRLQSEAAQALAQIQGQLGVGGQTDAQRQQLQEQQQNLARFMSLLQNRPPAQPDNTMLYVALAGLGAFLIYTQMNKTPAPAPRRNPHRRSRRRVRR